MPKKQLKQYGWLYIARGQQGSGLNSKLRHYYTRSEIRGLINIAEFIELVEDQVIDTRNFGGVLV